MPYVICGIDCLCHRTESKRFDYVLFASSCNLFQEFVHGFRKRGLVVFNKLVSETGDEMAEVAYLFRIGLIVDAVNKGLSLQLFPYIFCNPSCLPGA